MLSFLCLKNCWLQQGSWLVEKYWFQITPYLILVQLYRYNWLLNLLIRTTSPAILDFRLVILRSRFNSHYNIICKLYWIHISRLRWVQTCLHVKTFCRINHKLRWLGLKTWITWSGNIDFFIKKNKADLSWSLVFHLRCNIFLSTLLYTILKPTLCHLNQLIILCLQFLQQKISIIHILF